MNILDSIVEHKLTEVAERKELFPVKLLEQSIYFSSPCVSMVSYLRRPGSTGIIAEIKRASPSKGLINPEVNVEEVSIGYMQAGAAALSVLTDQEFFKGSGKDLSTARRFNYCPILRKDFIVDPYQIVEARSFGADVILLIAAILDGKQIRKFTELAHELGMEVLLEVHSEDEIKKANTQVDLVGINNRDLTSFNVDLNTSRRLLEALPGEVTKVSESGLQNPQDVDELRRLGFHGFLIGEQFMRHARPHRACADFISRLETRSVQELCE